MPLLTIKTNIQLENKISIAELASELTTQILGKPESYVMVNIEDNQCLMFAGDHQPCALVKLKSLNLPETTTTDFSSSLCDFINTQTGIDTSRIYIEFSNPERHMWGWNKRTF
ncbi:MAG: hypothetical protein DIZ80_14305 [endosymbiont of Galathealinum brachiosum]|uniref:L-dopachrome isomerase n=1 Tax=endosymbiont of Galathealinum brachiosum TaxID=2200906 RepID=A0A370DA82_9GAMM|nr:MAG: hypothetical protein DIZ80_14305 [endosymbiont of Galathealinum brachiosum]